MNDILLNADLDLDVANGDFRVGNSDVQHQNLLLQTNKGEWKRNPTVGVDAEGYLLDEDLEGLFRSIREQFAADGMTVNEIAPTADKKLSIDAKY